MSLYPPIAPEHGVIHAWVKGKGRVEPVASIEDVTNQPGEWRWLHLDANRESTNEWVESLADGDEEVPSILLAEWTRPRCEISEDRLLFVGRGANLNPNAAGLQMLRPRRCFAHGYTVIPRAEG